jgi:Receptor family ligand binding region
VRASPFHSVVAHVCDDLPYVLCLRLPQFGLQIMLAFEEIGVDGVVGAASSSVSGVAAMAGSIYDIPQISYSSTSPNLSDKEIYPFFR